MHQNLTIALDGMGGDNGLSVVVGGAAISLERHPSLQFLIAGSAAELNAELNKHPRLKERTRVLPTDIVIAMDDKPSQALRRGKGSSMWLALEAVKNGEADVAVSAGNTGALMAMAKLILRPMPGIERPGIAAL